MIIEDLRDRKLELSDEKLAELSKGEMNCFTTYAQIRKGVVGGRLSVWFVDRCPKESVSVPIFPKTQVIGCCRFSPATFAKILKAAGVKPVRKTNSRRKK